MCARREYVHRAYATHNSLERVFFLILDFYIILFTLCYFVLFFAHLPVFRINQLNTESVPLHHRAEIQKLFEKYSQGKYIGLLHKNTVFTFPGKDFAHDIYTLDSRFNHVDITIDHPSSRVTINQFSPEYLLEKLSEPAKCVSSSDKTIAAPPVDEQCEEGNSSGVIHQYYWVTKDGYIYAEAPVIIGAPVPIIMDLRSGGFSTGMFLPSQDIVYINEFYDAIREYGLNIREVTFEKEGDIILNFGYHWNILVSERKMIQESIEQIVLALRELGPLAFDDSGKISFIDVRFGNKVFYK